jgi:hypothetical protein
MNQKKESPVKRIWALAESQHKRLKGTVILAVFGVLMGFIPYYAVAKCFHIFNYPIDFFLWKIIPRN